MEEGSLGFSNGTFGAGYLSNKRGAGEEVMRGKHY